MRFLAPCLMMHPGKTASSRGRALLDTSRVFAGMCLLIVACRCETGATSRTRVFSEKPLKPEVQNETSHHDCMTVLRVVDDLELTGNGIELELSMRVDFPGGSETVRVRMQGSQEDYCLNAAIPSRVRPRVHFDVTGDTPVCGRFDRGTWIFWGPVGHVATDDGRRIILVPLSRFRYWDDAARIMAP